MDDAKGAILGHSIRAGTTVLRKGRLLSEADAALLRASGIRTAIVARLEDGDLHEDLAAARIAAACAGPGVGTAAPFTGRANLYADHAGLAVVDADLVSAVNTIHESITLATVTPFARVAARQMLATVKIIPFSAPEKHVLSAEHLLRQGPALAVAAFRPRQAALISTFLPGTRPSLLDKNRAAIAERLSAVGSVLVSESRVPHEVDAVARALRDAGPADPILVFGAGAIVDRRDVIPAAVEAAGGTVETFGMPVDPGNLLLMAALNGATVVGLPSCARSPRPNGVDFVLWRIAAGLPVGRKEIAAMGVGGLLSEIPGRPQPREERPPVPARRPRIAALVLAAGRSSRMGSNKLLAEIGGKPLVRYAVESAVKSSADPVIVVTGNAAEATAEALQGFPIRFRNNPDFTKGLSSSLKCGLSGLPEDADGVLVMLADMPGVPPALLDRLIAAFDPDEGRAICVATRHGRRGNPVLWGRRFFSAIMAIEGDTGARHLIGENEDLVCEVEAEDDGPLTDIDTPEALEAYRAR